MCPEPFCNSGCVTLLDDVDGDDDGSDEGGDEADDDGDVTTTTKKTTTTTTTSRNLARPRMGYESEAADPSGRPSLSDD